MSDRRKTPQPASHHRPCCCFLFLFCICHNILTETPTWAGGKHHQQYYVVDYILLLLTYLLDWVVLFLCIISPFFSCLPKCHQTGSPLPLKRRSVRSGKQASSRVRVVGWVICCSCKMVINLILVGWLLISVCERATFASATHHHMWRRVNVVNVKNMTTTTSTSGEQSSSKW